MGPLLKLTIVAFLIWGLVGCAVPYRPETGSGGFKETKLNENTFEVSFEGNHYNTLDEVRTYLTYRCAELTLEQGLTHFLIIEDLSYEDTQEKEFMDSDMTIETRTSMSGGVSTNVRSNFGAEAMAANPVGKFLIMMRVGPDPVHPNASMDAKQFIELNDHLIKR